MARRSAQETPRRSLSAWEAAVEIRRIDLSIAAFWATAPTTFDALGGRQALASLSQQTCLGPIPRLTAETWELAAREYVERQRQQKTPWEGRRRRTARPQEIPPAPGPGPELPH